ncbi:MAG: outer membrane beta-barrel family protein [Paludibacteraceae bacterium]|nr:outer membrane beta-barrel family protein [Paludibacteraceae bacterium]
MKKQFLSLLFLIVSITMYAQVSLKGTIIEQSSNKPMQYVPVALMKGETPVKSIISAEDGSFKLDKIDIGSYTLKISFMGYTTINKKITISGKNPHVDLGSVFLADDARALKEVEVVAQAPQVKFEPDKKVFSVDQTMAASGGSATDVLQNIPSVSVDNSGNVSLRNNSNVVIWINGKPAGLTDDNQGEVLDQMPAGSIQSVELITNPSAKYSAEGSAGIINLVMKEDRKAGIFGNVSSGLIYPAKGKLGENEGANINFTAGKFDGYVTLGFRNYNYGTDATVNRYYYNSSNMLRYTLYQQSKQRNDLEGFMTRYGVNYHPDRKNTIGISGFVISGSRDGTNNLDYLKDSAATTLSDYYRTNTSNNHRTGGNTVLEHSLQLDKKTELNSSLSYSFFNSDADATYIQGVNQGVASTLNQKQKTTGNNKSAELKSDFSKKFHEKNKLETGLDIALQDKTSTSNSLNFEDSTYQSMPLLYNDYEYKSQVYSLYGTYSTSINKLSIQTGVRGEYIVIDNSTNGVNASTKKYLKPFPSVFLSYSLPNKNEIQLNYTRRINLAKGRQLNSYKDVSDSTNISYGNPDLKPEYLNSFELNHIKTWDKNTLSSSLYFHSTENVIQQVSFLNQGVLNTTYMNVSRSESTGLEIIYQNSMARFMNFTTTLNMYYRKLLFSNLTLSDGQTIPVNGSDNFSWTARLIANFLFSKTLSGQLSGNYISPQAINQGQSEKQYYMDLGLKKTLFKRKLTLALTVQDVFHTRKTVNTTSSTKFEQYYEAVPLGPTCRFTVSYNFGTNNEKKKKNNKKNNLEDNNTNDDNSSEEF